MPTRSRYPVCDCIRPAAAGEGWSREHGGLRIGESAPMASAYFVSERSALDTLLGCRFFVYFVKLAAILGNPLETGGERGSGVVVCEGSWLSRLEIPSAPGGTSGLAGYGMDDGVVVVIGGDSGGGRTGGMGPRH